jgi:hypothetical protein
VQDRTTKKGQDRPVFALFPSGAATCSKREEFMRLVLSIQFLLLAFLAAANAEAPKVDRIEITEAGIYQRGNVASGAMVDSARLIQATTTIPARIGLTFGIRGKLVGQPSGAKVALKKVTRFPPPGIRNSATGKMQSSEDESIIGTIGAEFFTDGRFDDPDEMIPGNWVIEIWYENQRLAQQQFTVVKP